MRLRSLYKRKERKDNSDLNNIDKLFFTDYLIA